MKKSNKLVAIANIVLVVLAFTFLVKSAIPVNSSSFSIHMNTDIDFRRIPTRIHERIEVFQNRVAPVLSRSGHLVSNLNETIE